MSAVLSLHDIHHSYTQGSKGLLHVLRGVNLDLQPGQITALLGQSGEGKSTLLHIAGLLEHPTKGKVMINGHSGYGLTDADRSHLRGAMLGFVYQAHLLLPEFTALENIIMPQVILGKSWRQAMLHAGELLESLGLRDRMLHYPTQLSGGEQQRVAIARALANKPKVLLADEPTGNLDPETAAEVFEILLQATRVHGTAALIATHNYDLAARMDRIVRLHEGILQEDKRQMAGI